MLSLKTLFIPYRAFEILGETDENKILKIYLSAFQGIPSKLTRTKKRSPFIAGLSERLYLFYNVSVKPVQGLYNVMDEIGIFAEFYERFCSVPNIPTFLSPQLFQCSKNRTRDDFFLQIYNNELKQIENLSPMIAKRVNLRRSLQTRAYFAFQLQMILQKHSIISLGRSQFSSKELATSVRIYIDMLEKALRALCHNESVISVMRNMNVADTYYEKNVRRQFLKLKLWVGTRNFLFPPREVENINIATNTPIPLSRKQRAGLSSFFLKRVHEQVRISTSLAQKEKYLQALSDLLKSISRSQSTRSVSKILASPTLLSLWSVSLSAVNPVANKFQELLFVYE